MSKRIVGHYAALKAYWDKRAPGWEGDHTFDMLYAMKGEELDNLLFLPFFEEKLLKYGEGDSGYWQFLFDMYPKLVVTNLSTQTIVDSGSYELKREVEQGLADGESTSFLFNFFKTEKNISHADEISKIRWSYKELRFFGGHYIERSIVEDENGDHVPYYYGDNPIPIINYQVNHNGLPKYLFTLRPKNIKTGTSEISNELYDKLISEDFPLKREYNELCRWVKSSRENLDSYSDYQSIIDSLC
jgi:hypothetical protein